MSACSSANSVVSHESAGKVDASAVTQPIHGQVTPKRDDPEANTADLIFLAPSARLDALGRVDHYQVLDVRGRGGFGIVLKAFDEKLHRIVALKVLAPPLAACPLSRKRFLREAQAAAAIRNDHVVGIFAVEDGPWPYIVMEYVDGPSLEEKIARDGPLPLDEILRIGKQAATGLAAAHQQGLIHRDIKPGNILLENGVARVKITDFGLARAMDDASLSQAGVVYGTPAYMAPEQVASGDVDHRADLFSLGSVLYMLCTGAAHHFAARARWRRSVRSWTKSRDLCARSGRTPRHGWNVSSPDCMPRTRTGSTSRPRKSPSCLPDTLGRCVEAAQLPRRRAASFFAS